nr:hypothetical protein [Tanacetum cinerariifolium]
MEVSTFCLLLDSVSFVLEYLDKRLMLKGICCVELSDVQYVWHLLAFSSCADESFIVLMRDLCSALRVSITKNRRLITELEALGPQGDALKPFDYMRELVVIRSHLELWKNFWLALMLECV